MISKREPPFLVDLIAIAWDGFSRSAAAAVAVATIPLWATVLLIVVFSPNLAQPNTWKEALFLAYVFLAPALAAAPIWWGEQKRGLIATLFLSLVYYAGSMVLLSITAFFSICIFVVRCE